MHAQYTDTAAAHLAVAGEARVGDLREHGIVHAGGAGDHVLQGAARVVVSPAPATTAVLRPTSTSIQTCHRCLTQISSSTVKS